MVILPTEAVFRYEMMTVSKIQENLALFLTPMFLTQNTPKNLKNLREKTISSPGRLGLATKF